MVREKCGGTQRLADHMDIFGVHNERREQRIGAVLIDPDVVLSGTFCLIAETLGRAGFEIRSWQLLELSVAAMRRVYRKQEATSASAGSRERPDAPLDDSWQALSALYGLAPAVLLVVRHEDGDAFGRLGRIKGHKRPELAAAGTIRAATDAESVILNSVHIPDDPTNAQREVAFLLPPADVAGHARLAMAGPPDLSEGFDAAADIANTLPVLQGRAAISFPEVTHRVRRRIAHSLSLRGNSDEAARALVRQVRVLLAGERAALDETSTAQARLRVGMHFNVRLTQCLTNLTETSRATRLLSVIESLHALFDLNGSRDVEPILRLPDSGIYLAGTEAMAIRAHSASFRPNKYLTPIYGHSA